MVGKELRNMHACLFKSFLCKCTKLEHSVTSKKTESENMTSKKNTESGNMTK